MCSPGSMKQEREEADREKVCRTGTPGGGFVRTPLAGGDRGSEHIQKLNAIVKNYCFDHVKDDHKR